MEENKKNKIIALSVIVISVLVIIVIGTSIAFFNYTRTGGINTVRTGRVDFISEENVE